MIGSIKLIMLTVIAVLALWTGVVYAQSPDTDAVPSQEFIEKMDAKREQFYKELNLTVEQKKALEENKNKSRQAAKALKDNIRAKRNLMRAELEKEQLDMNKVNKIQSELKALQAQMLDQRLEGILEVRKILTPDQFKEFGAKMGDRMERFGREGKGPKQGFKKGGYKASVPVSEDK